MATLEEACRIVEAAAKKIGKNCEILFAEDGVQVAPLEWSGYAFGKTLYGALHEASKDIVAQKMLEKHPEDDIEFVMPSVNAGVDKDEGTEAEVDYASLPAAFEPTKDPCSVVWFSPPDGKDLRTACGVWRIVKAVSTYGKMIWLIDKMVDGKWARTQKIHYSGKVLGHRHWRSEAGAKGWVDEEIAGLHKKAKK